MRLITRAQYLPGYCFPSIYCKVQYLQSGCPVGAGSVFQRSDYLSDEDRRGGGWWTGRRLPVEQRRRVWFGNLWCCRNEAEEGREPFVFWLNLLCLHYIPSWWWLHFYNSKIVYMCLFTEACGCFYRAPVKPWSWPYKLEGLNDVLACAGKSQAASIYLIVFLYFLHSACLDSPLMV